jgi:predicted ATPase
MQRTDAEDVDDADASIVIKRVRIKNFKRFGDQVFDLRDTVVFAGPNNSGKTTVLQALAVWNLARIFWRQVTEGGRKARRRRIALTRKDFTALPLREFNLLWNERRTALNKAELAPGQKLGTPRDIVITVEGEELSEGKRVAWVLAMEIRYQGPEQVYVRLIDEEGSEGAAEPGLALNLVHCPPFSGIGAEERRLDHGAQDLEIGQGKPGNILRNLLLEVSEDEESWRQLKRDIDQLFSVELLKPVYHADAQAYIRCEYRAASGAKDKAGNPARLDIATGGSGFHQVLLLLSLFYARPSTVLLLDEPDAHLHVLLQDQIYEHLRRVAQQRGCQLIIATHSEVILDGTSPSRVVSFIGPPHPLVTPVQRDQVREAMARLSTLELLLAEQGRAVLYVERDSDFRLLRAWAEVLGHPALRFFSDPFYRSLGGHNPREARRHLFALRAVRGGLCGMLVLDRDNRELPDREVAGEGLRVFRWTRYEIENYLLVPNALERWLEARLGGRLFAAPAMEFLRQQLPSPTFENPLEDNAAVMRIPASKDLLPQLFERAGIDVEKSDYFLVAETMTEDEIHPDVTAALDAIADLLPGEEEA